jgi:type I restriction enzyme S subunit
MEVREGYKHTEVGVIPEDWELHSLKQEIDALNAGVSVNSVKDNVDSSHDYSILKTSSVYNGVFNPQECKKILLSDIHRAKLNPLKDHIIISRMNTPDLVGECGYVIFDYPQLFLPDRLWMIEFKKSSELNVRWLSYILSYSPFRQKIKDIGTGTSGSMKNISKAKLLEINIPYPPKSEQTAIATALSDTDALISSLEKLIAKKRLIKQGAMQELLSPTGLDGKPKEGWVVKKLGEVIFDFQNGFGFSPIGYVKEGTPIVTMAQIGLDGSFNFDETKVNNWISEDFQSLKNFHLKNGDLIIAMTDVTPEKNLIGRMAIVKTNQTLLLNQRVGLIRLDKQKVNPYFLKTYSNMRKWRAYCIGSASLGVQANIGTKDILNGLIELPDILEQNKSAQILSDMDAEITTLETKLEKYRKIKLGMMQELLTGRIRLIVNC